MTACPDEQLAERFRVEQQFSGGEGWSALVRAHDDSLGVLKVLAPGWSLEEGSLLASLQHPAVPRILETGTTADGSAYLLRGYVPGSPLAERLPLEPEQALELATQLLEVLAYVHLRGVLHLDLKPANIIATDEDGSATRYSLLDFGLGARLGVVQTGGTAFFASPEQLLGVTPGPRSDLFSLGAVLLAAMQRRPLPLSRFLAQFPDQDFFTACDLDPASLPEPFRRFLPRLLSRRPDRRFADAQDALEQLTGGSGRPGVSLLKPDPIAVYGGELEATLQELIPEQGLRLYGGHAEDRRLLAIHCACVIGSGYRIEEQNGDTILTTGGDNRLQFELRPMTEPQVTVHLQRSLGLSPEAAEAATVRVLRDADGSPHDIGRLLEGLVRAGQILPDGVRWIWPAAASGRLEETAELPPGPTTPATLEHAASRGLGEQAMHRFRTALAESDPGRERELRAGLAQGFLLGGEPGRALPLTHDLPLHRCRALLELGRVGEAEAYLPAARDAAEADPLGIVRLEAKIAFNRGRVQEALEINAALTGNQSDEEGLIAQGLFLAAAGQQDESIRILQRALKTLDIQQHPYLRAAALTNLALAQRNRGQPEPALELFEDAQRLLHTLGHVRHAATIALNLGVLSKDLSRHQEAIAHLRRARSMYRYVGDATGSAVSEANLGIVAIETQDYAGAESLLAKALSSLVELGAEEPLPLTRVMLARAQAALGKREAAERNLVEAGPLASARLQQEAAQVREILDTPERPAAKPTPQNTTVETRSGDQGFNRELFRTFQAVNRRLATEADLRRAMDFLLDSAVTLTGGRRGYLLLSRPDGVRLECQAGESSLEATSFSRSLANRSMQEQRTLSADDVLADQGLLEMPSVQQLRVRSVVCAPFISASGARGAIYVEHPGRARAFSDGDKEHLEVMADQAAIAVDRMLHEEQLQRDLKESRRDLAVASRGTRRKRVDMVGQSGPMNELRDKIAKIARSDIPVLILGETGTGKELVARSVHEQSARNRGPYVSESCSAIPSELMEREMFGHVQGAFTGADRDVPGLLELASGGTLFLDEVGDMPAGLQAKLLRALQERTIRRVGGTKSIPVDIRLLTATHKELRKLIEENAFREDLYYRLAAVELRVPALRNRTGDIPILSEVFLERLNQQHRTQKKLGASAIDALRQHNWPGNVRELEHAVARAFLMAEGDILDGLLLPKPDGAAQKAAGETGPAEWPVISLREAERRTIRAALEACGGDKTKTARTLGISRTALYEKLKRMDLS